MKLVRLNIAGREWVYLDLLVYPLPEGEVSIFLDEIETKGIVLRGGQRIFLSEFPSGPLHVRVAMYEEDFL